VKIEVDTGRCTGHAQCEGVAPEVFEVGDDGLVRVLEPSPSEDQRAAVQEAVDLCPTQALTLRS
jgi:ferredoxin